MPVTDPIQIPIEGNASDFIADAKKVQEQMDILKYRLEKAGVSQSAYNTAVNNAKAAMNAHTEASKKNSLSMTDLRSAYMMAADAVRVLQQGYEITVGAAMEYDQKIYDIMVSTGATAEQTSRMVQVLDDAGVSFETVKKAMKEMGKDGIAPSMDELARLSDEFIKIKDPAEKVKFQLDHFGKSGTEMARALTLGGTALRKMNDEMEGGLVLTDKNIKDSEKYRKNLDDLQDTFDGIAISLGNGFIPKLNESAIAIKKNIDAYDNFKEQSGEFAEFMNYPISTIIKWVSGIDSSSEAAIAARDAVNAHADALDGSISALEEHTGAVELDEEAIKELSRSNSEYLSVVSSLTDQQADHEEQIEEINKDYADGKITMEERAAALDELAAKQEEASRRMILSMLQEQLAADGLSTAEMKYLLQTGEQWGIYSASAVAAADAAMAKAAELGAAFNSLPTRKDMMINVYTNQSAMGAATQAQTLGAASRGHAAGGSFLIPMSYGNEGFRMGNGDTASGGEQVTITPRNQQQTSPRVEIDYNKMAKAIVQAQSQAGW